MGRTPSPAKRKRMCPNDRCEKFNQPTGLMGGCDCGTALVPYQTMDEMVDDALWKLASPTMKRLVGYAMVADMDKRRRGARQ